jgi:hypothetical protein
MHVFGAGVGRTGTYSLREALVKLGYGPCHHMRVVIEDMAHNVPLWETALAGNPDWDAIYAGQNSAVDWPSASFYRELHAAFPAAKFVLTVRSPESWVESFSETIQLALAGRDEAPPPVQPWMDMCLKVIARAGFRQGMSAEELARAFVAHRKAVEAAIPAEQLLVFEARQGWEPLCEFLGEPVPAEPFPRTNNRDEFWDLVKGGG